MWRNSLMSDNKCKKPNNDNGRFPSYKSEFPMDTHPRSNQVQYYIRNRNMLHNWLKTFGVPCLLLKLKKEFGDPLNNNNFSEVDKLVIAYGKQGLAFDMVPKAYDVFQIYLPIETQQYSKLSNKFQDTLACIAPVDDRFTYSKCDIILFRMNDFVFRFEIAAEPAEYLGISVELTFRYIDKKDVSDRVIVDPDHKTTDQSKYW